MIIVNSVFGAVFKHLLLRHRTMRVHAVYGGLLGKEDTGFGAFVTTKTEVVLLTKNYVRFTIISVSNPTQHKRT